jgi:hypothetical protein
MDESISLDFFLDFAIFEDELLIDSSIIPSSLPEGP